MNEQRPTLFGLRQYTLNRLAQVNGVRFIGGHADGDERTLHRKSIAEETPPAAVSGRGCQLQTTERLAS
jgi:hypothetical protein